MNILKTFCLFLIIGKFSSAQIIISQEAKSPSVEFIGLAGSLFLTAETHKGKDSFNHSLLINAYDSLLKLKSSTEVKNNYHNDDSQFFLIDSTVFITLEETYGSLRKFSIGYTVSVGGIGKKSELEIFNINQFKELKKLASESYSFISKQSSSGTKLAFIYENDYLPKYNNEIKFRILNGDSLSEIKSFIIPYGCDVSQTRSYVYNDLTGEKLFVLVSIFDQASERKRKVVETKLFEFDLDNSHLSTIDIPVGSDYSSCKLASGNGNMIMTFLKRNKEESTLSGFKFAAWNGSETVLKDIDFENPLSTKWRFINKDLNTKGSILNSGRNNYSLRTLEFLDPSMLIAIVELNVREGSTSTPGMMTGNGMVGGGAGSPIYLAGDLIVAGVDITTDSSFAQIIKKNQDFERSNYISYLALKRNNHLQIIFSDVDKEKSDIFFSTYKSNNYSIRESVIENPVKVFSNELFNQENKYRIQTQSLIKFSEDAVVIAATIKGKESYLIKLRLSE